MHFTEIANVHNKLFPDKQLSYRSTHATLSFCAHPDTEKHGIVWVRIRGTYALKEWGYKRPNLGLYDAIENIVNRLYKKTGKPVSYNLIQAEISKERNVINPQSVFMTANMNENLKKLPNNLFVPLDEKDNSEVVSEKELDKILSSFREKQVKKLNQSVIL